MAKRKLSDEEVRALGLEATPVRRKVSPEEVAQLGLEQPESGMPEGTLLAPDAPIAPIERPAPSVATTFAQQYTQGALKGWDDELFGKIHGFREKRKALNEGASEAEAERWGAEAGKQLRNTGRRMDVAQEKAHPWLSLGAEALGDMTTDAIGTGLAGGAYMNPIVQGAIGLAQGLGDSNLDTDTANTSDYVGAGVASGLTGLARGGGAFVGRAGAKWLKGSKLAQYFGGKVGKAVEDAAELGGKEAGEIIDSAVGKSRQKIADTHRGVELVERYLPGVSEDAQHVINENLAGVDLPALKERLAKSASKRVQTAGAEMDALEAAIPDFAALKAAKTQEILNQPFKRAILPIIQRYGPPIAGSIVGGSTGSDVLRAGAGAALGAAFGPEKGVGWKESLGGALAGAGMRPALRAIVRRFNDPGVRKMIWGTLKGSLESTAQRLGEFGPALTAAAAKGSDALLATHEALMVASDYYKAKWAELIAEEEANASLVR